MSTYNLCDGQKGSRYKERHTHTLNALMGLEFERLILDLMTLRSSGYRIHRLSHKLSPKVQVHPPAAPLT